MGLGMDVLDSDHASSAEDQVVDDSNSHIPSDLESAAESGSEQEAADAVSSSQQHVITFKCIGTTHDPNTQHILSEVSQCLEKGKSILVMIVPKSENQHDSEAIAFKCKVEGEWHRTGYIVKEAVDHVHLALEQEKITSIKFSWVKYLVAINGRWPLEVCRCASTH